MHMFIRSFVYYSPAANLLYRQTPLSLEDAPCHSALYPRTECTLGPCRSACVVLTTGWCKGERRRPQCTCNFTVVGNREAVETLKQLLYYTLTTQPTRAYRWTSTGHAWDHLSHPVDVCVGRFPAVCAKPVQLNSHVG